MEIYTIRVARLEDITEIIAIEKSAGQKFASLPIEFLSKFPENIPAQDPNFMRDIN